MGSVSGKEMEGWKCEGGGWEMGRRWSVGNVRGRKEVESVTCNKE